MFIAGVSSVPYSTQSAVRGAARYRGTTFGHGTILSTRTTSTTALNAIHPSIAFWAGRRSVAICCVCHAFSMVVMNPVRRYNPGAPGIWGLDMDNTPQLHWRQRWSTPGTTQWTRAGPHLQCCQRCGRSALGRGYGPSAVVTTAILYVLGAGATLVSGHPYPLALLAVGLAHGLICLPHVERFPLGILAFLTQYVGVMTAGTRFLSVRPPG